MAISEREWASVASLAEKIAVKKAGQRGDFITGQVFKRDKDRKLIWLKETGDQPIPVIAFDYDVKYYDTNNTGVVNVKHAVVSAQTPDIGETVFVAFEMGDKSLPRCLGVIQSTGWQLPEDEA